MEFEEFETYLRKSDLGCTSEAFQRLQAYILRGGTAAPATATYIELGQGENKKLESGQPLPDGLWARLDDPTVHDLVREGVLASGVPARRPY
jgi:hypothetical protein